MKILSQETNLGIGTTVSSATVVRAYNSDSNVGIVTRKDSGGSDIGNLTIPSGKVVYLEKKFNDSLIAPATVKASKIAYSPVMEYASWLEGGGGGGSSIVDTDLYVHYDFSSTDCWNRNNSANAADYTVNNLANDYNDAVFRSRTGTSDAWQNDSSSPVIDFNNSDGGGCLEINPANHEGVEDSCSFIIPGSFSHSTNTGYYGYNLPTVSSTDSNNLWNGVGTGAFTIEFWERYYWQNNDEFYRREEMEIHAVVAEENSNTWRWPLRWYVYGDTQSSSPEVFHKMYNHNHDGTPFPWEYVYHDIPGATSSGSGWSDWCHIVFSRASNATNDSKLYLNNSLVETDTYSQTLEYSPFTNLFRILGAASEGQFRMGLFRIYRGKALTASEVTQNWDAQKSRFGH